MYLGPQRSSSQEIAMCKRELNVFIGCILPIALSFSINMKRFGFGF